MKTLLISLFLVVLSLPASAGDIQKRALTSRGKPRTYYLFVPESVTAEKPAALLVTLHGSGRNGKILVEKWKTLAGKEGIVLAGPDATDPEVWTSPEDGPLFLRDLVEELKSKHPIDPRRVYLFGHSAGAVFGLQMAVLESQYFAAAVVHAGALEPQYFGLFDYATRKVPIALIVGERDRLFPLKDVRETRDALAARGIPVVLTEISGHDHNYYVRSAKINKGAWEFLSKERLPADPKYTPYLDAK